MILCQPMTISFRKLDSLLCVHRVHRDWDQLSLKLTKMRINWTLNFGMNYSMSKTMCTIYKVENYWINRELMQTNMVFTLCNIRGPHYGIPYFHIYILGNLSSNVTVGTANDVMSYILYIYQGQTFMRHLEMSPSCLSIISPVCVSWRNKHYFCVRVLHESCVCDISNSLYTPAISLPFSPVYIHVHVLFIPIPVINATIIVA